MKAAKEAARANDPGRRFAKDQKRSGRQTQPAGVVVKMTSPGQIGTPGANKGTDVD